MHLRQCDQDSRKCATGGAKASLAAHFFLGGGQSFIPYPKSRPFFRQKRG